ncbi:MAG TPA: Ig-like domain-containing protein, partial [Gemmatimonadales bacterium]|nr:Ig-like domain-containing protein [Gemmatimonadales bacterium]
MTSRLMAGWSRLAGVSAAATLVAVACIEGPTGPGSQPPSAVSVSLVLPPATPPIWFPQGESLHVAVRRAGRAEPIVDTSLVIAASLAADLQVPMSQAVESFVATAEVLYAGSLYFLAFEAIRIRAGSDTAITLAAAYVGPGARAASYALSLNDSTLRRGDTTSLVPVVLDSTGQRIDNVPARYVSRRPAIVTVGSTGVVAAQQVPPDTARIAGFLPMGLGDSLVARVRSRADSLVLVSGSGQTGARLYPLVAAVTVQVLGDDGAPVSGEPVTFTADPGDGSFSPASVMTDPSGRAASVWTLGARVGAQQASIGAEGVAPIMVWATAAALPVDSIAVTPANDQLRFLGATRQLAAAAFDTVGAVLSETAFTWSSSESAVITVDSTGLVTAVADGNATISARADGVVGTAVLAVARVVAGVAVSPPAASLTSPGATQQFSAAAQDSGGAPMPAVMFVWAATPGGIATVDSTGLATAIGEGSATINATSGDVTGSAQLLVSFSVVNATEEIVFISTRDGNREVYAMEADGTGARRLTNSPEDEYRPGWAPDRSAVVFEREVDGTRQIFRVNGGGGGEAQL